MSPLGPPQPTWGVVATIRAPARQILDFAAHHVELGAHRVHIFLDQPNEEARRALRHHPKCRVFTCDDAYWGGQGRKPEKHQVRQTRNATHCLHRRPQVDWLAHIDADEFLWPGDTPLPRLLAEIPDDALSARVRPIEALAPDPDPDDPPPEGVTWFKSCARLNLTRRAETDAIYPRFGPHLNGGFLSHVTGKVFIRTGIPDTSLRIHNAFRAKMRDDDPAEMPGCRLCHLHAPDWRAFLATYRFRLLHGSYRESLRPAPLAGDAPLNMHALFRMIEEEGGEAALHDFFTEVCTATPDLRARLARFGHLHALDLDLDAKRARQFPEHA